jgi:hypothetical protein
MVFDRAAKYDRLETADGTEVTPEVRPGAGRRRLSMKLQATPFHTRPIKAAKP